MATRRPIDLRRERADEYALARTPHLVRVAQGRYLAVEGQGAPEGDGFGRAVHALYAMVHTIEASAEAVGRAFKVMPLEAQWWGDGEEADFTHQPRERWRYRVMIRVPDFVGDRDLAAARELLEASGRGEGVEAVELERFAEGRCVQALHVGPFASERETVERMLKEAAARGLGFVGPHHEIYLSDPRRTPPEKLRTLLRHPVRRAARA